jgi:hypothetical protein
LNDQSTRYTFILCQKYATIDPEMEKGLGEWRWMNVLCHCMNVIRNACIEEDKINILKKPEISIFQPTKWVSRPALLT